jgi:hypothetical protein
MHRTFASVSPRKMGKEAHRDQFRKLGMKPLHVGPLWNALEINGKSLESLPHLAVPMTSRFPRAIGQPGQEGSLLVDLAYAGCDEHRLLRIALLMVYVRKPNQTEAARVCQEVGGGEHH